MPTLKGSVTASHNIFVVYSRGVYAVRIRESVEKQLGTGLVVSANEMLCGYGTVLHVLSAAQSAVPWHC